MSMHKVDARRRSGVVTRNVVVTAVLGLAFSATEALAGTVHVRRVYRADAVRVVAVEPVIVRPPRIVYYRVAPRAVRVVVPAVPPSPGRVVVVGRRPAVHVHAHGVVVRR